MAVEAEVEALNTSSIFTTNNDDAKGYSKAPMMQMIALFL